MQTVIKQTASPRSLPGRKQSGVLIVLSWELRRIANKRSTWVLAFLVLSLFCGLSWLVREPVGIGLSTKPNEPVDLIITAHLTSGWGLIHSLPIPMLTIFGLFLPFVSADGASMDIKRRTHELLMTTSISSPAFLIGRYLAVTLLSLILSGLMLGGIAASAFIYNLPFPDLLTFLELWGVIVLPATLLLASISFALGTWFSKHTNIVKAMVVMLWFVLTFVMQTMQPFNTIGTTRVGNIPIIDSHSPILIAFWEPTSILLSKVVESNYFSQFYRQPGNQVNLPAEAVRATQALRAVEQAPPDLSSWFWSHLILILIGPVVVLVASVRFRRFRNQLN